jgi:predicted PurR-regulated permease PerM
VAQSRQSSPAGRPQLLEEPPDEGVGLVLPPTVERESRHGPLGKPLDRRAPFLIGLTGALGVAVAYFLVHAVADIAAVLLLVGIALFLAVGLEPAVQWLIRHGVPRVAAVGLILLCFLAVVGGFIAAAVPPIVGEVRDLSHNLPHYRAELAAGHGFLGQLVVKFHLQRYVRSSKLPVNLSLVGGVLGAGKLIISAFAGVTTVIALTIYFLVAMPAVRHLWLRFVPASRRLRAESLTDDVFDRVGGFVLGNLLTSLVTGVGTTVWLIAWGVPYPVLLGLFVALVDLVPIIGSTVGGVIVSLVALVRGPPVAIATAFFYCAYRLFEDYFLTPRVMGHTVRISPGLTIVATLIGGSLLGLIGALIAIPVAATVHLVLEEIVFPRLNRA